MSAHDHSPNELDASTDGRYADVETADERVIYDTENASAWIASDTSHSRAEML